MDKEVLATKPDHLSLSLVTHAVEGKNQLMQVVLRLPHMPHPTVNVREKDYRAL